MQDGAVAAPCTPLRRWNEAETCSDPFKYDCASSSGEEVRGVAEKAHEELGSFDRSKHMKMFKGLANADEDWIEVESSCTVHEESGQDEPDDAEGQDEPDDAEGQGEPDDAEGLESAEEVRRFELPPDKGGMIASLGEFKLVRKLQRGKVLYVVCCRAGVSQVQLMNNQFPTALLSQLERIGIFLMRQANEGMIKEDLFKLRNAFVVAYQRNMFEELLGCSGW